ncbi:hypothetical protein [Bradyrhizobium sp. BWC-3-1]|uniref:hypothetical protein n=1 Tax=Bradyrhizobium sp. BWC-3-1 TaxID=3080012 RepID=UPI00293EE471|nr:hypothetical protein [Bradyrhizobium sp. BWC-3-1]WOH55138.1 hypothetical protein RX329_22710 [Bradyrhizobium sp. BWC-3-1]
MNDAFMEKAPKEGAGIMLHEIHQRDDGLYEVISGDGAAGPFPSYLFAEAIAEGRAPEPKPAFRRRFMIKREVSVAASA